MQVDTSKYRNHSREIRHNEGSMLNFTVFSDSYRKFAVISLVNVKCHLPSSTCMITLIAV